MAAMDEGGPGVRPASGRERATTRDGGHRHRVRHAAGVVVSELAHAVVWIVELGLLLISFFGLILTIPLLAEAERWAARLLGADAPSGHDAHRDQTYGSWVWGRLLTPDFWRRDLPTTLSTVLLSLVGLVGGFFLVFVGGVLVVTPFTASPSNPVEVTPLVTHATTAGEVWWLLPVGGVLLALAFLVLWGLGTVRLRIVSALSDTGGDARAAVLEGQVAGLRKGRATLVDAYEAERTRIERDLHDGAEQDLVALALTLGTARMAAGSGDLADPGAQGRVADLIDRAQEQTEAALAGLRQTVHGIHPLVLTDLGLAAAVEELAARSGLEVDARVTGSAEPSPPVATAVYFALAEALTNVARHAGVREAALTLDLDLDADLIRDLGPDAGRAGRVRATVSDHGAGGAVIGGPGHTGLAGMVERLEVVGGSVAIDSPIGVGTMVLLSAPLVPPW